MFRFSLPSAISRIPSSKSLRESRTTLSEAAESRALATVAASLLFLTTLLASFWPEEYGAGLGFRHELHIGFALIFLLLQAPVAAILVEQLQLPIVSDWRNWLAVYLRQLLLIAASLPLTLLLFWAGFYDGSTLLLIYLSSAITAAAFGLWATRKSSHLQVACVAVLYFLGLAGIFWWRDLHPLILVWSLLFLSAAVLHWYRSSNKIVE